MKDLYDTHQIEFKSLYDIYINKIINEIDNI